MRVKARIVVGRLLLVACVVLVVASGPLWSWRSEIHTRERVYATCPPLVPTKSCPFDYQTFVTGSKADHTPAILAVIAGATSGLLGVILVRPRSTQPTRDELLVAS